MVIKKIVDEIFYKKKFKLLKKIFVVIKKYRIEVDESEDEGIIDIIGIEEDIFLIIGNIFCVAKINIVVYKLSLFVQVDSFVMSESFVLEGIKYKFMFLEFGFSLDCQDELVIKGYKF